MASAAAGLACLQKAHASIGGDNPEIITETGHQKFGANFICVEMFDFQVEHNVSRVRQIIPRVQNRERAWMG